MLYIKLAHKSEFYTMPNFVWHVDAYFNNTYEDEWLDDPLVREMVLDVDKSEIVSYHCINSPVLGQIPPSKLSGGVKALILMLKNPNIVVYASNCGDNCSKWIQHIGKLKDLHIILGYRMRFGKVDDEMDAIIENDNTPVKTVGEYIDKCLEYLD